MTIDISWESGPLTVTQFDLPKCHKWFLFPVSFGFKLKTRSVLEFLFQNFEYVSNVNDFGGQIFTLGVGARRRLLQNRKIWNFFGDKLCYIATERVQWDIFWAVRMMQPNSQYTGSLSLGEPQHIISRLCRPVSVVTEKQRLQEAWTT